jgi:hypothetical protein
LIRPIVADEANVYFLESSGVFRVPADGGAPELIAERDNGTADLWLYDGQLLLSSDSLQTMSLTGGPRTKVIENPGFIAADHGQLQGDLLFRAENAFGSESPPGVQKVDLANKTVTLLATEPNKLVDRGVALAGDRFYVGLGPKDYGASTLSTMTLDGEMITPVLPGSSLIPHVADEQYLYLSGSLDGSDSSERYRMPLAHGVPDLIPERPNFGLVALAAGGLVTDGPRTTKSGAMQPASIWYLPWAGTPVRLGCVDHMSTVSVDWVGAFERTAYAAIGFKDKTASIARFALP